VYKIHILPYPQLEDNDGNSSGFFTTTLGYIFFLSVGLVGGFFFAQKTISLQNDQNTQISKDLEETLLENPTVEMKEPAKSDNSTPKTPPTDDT